MKENTVVPLFRTHPIFRKIEITSGYLLANLSLPLSKSKKGHPWRSGPKSFSAV